MVKGPGQKAFIRTVAAVGYFELTAPSETLSDQHENRLFLRSAFDLPQFASACSLNEQRKPVETFRRQGDQSILSEHQRTRSASAERQAL